MKICLYLEFSHFRGGIFFKKVGTGFASSYKNYLKALAAAGVRVTENPNDSYDLLHSNLPFLASLWQIFKARRKNKKIVISSHATAEDLQGVWRISKFLYPLAVWYYRFAYGLADAVVAPSQYTKSLLIKYGVDKKKIFVVSNGVDLKKFKNKKIRIKKRTGEILVVNVANTIPRKGTQTFARLAHQFPRCQFRWYGKIFNKWFYPSLPKRIPANAKFCGYAPNILAVYQSADIFLFPSYEENQGMVILEAAAMGLPIVVRDLPVYRGWLKNGVNCLIGKDDKDLTRHLGRLVRDFRLRQKISQGALKLAQDNDLKKTGGLLKKIYRFLL